MSITEDTHNKEYTSYSFLWSITDFTRAHFGGDSPIFKDDRKNEWQIHYNPTSNLPNDARVEVTLELKEFGDATKALSGGSLDVIVSIYVLSPRGKALERKYCTEALERFSFTAENRRYTRTCTGDARSDLAMIVVDKAVKIHCEILTEKPPGTYGEQWESSSLIPNFAKFLFDETFSDISVVAGNSTFPAHKAFLCARSEVFSRMFSTPMTECKENRVEISDFSAPVVKGMLEYIYTDKTVILPEFGEEWLRIADMYELIGLKMRAETTIGENLAVDNAVEVFHWSILYKTPTLKGMVIQFIKENLNNVAATTAIEELAKTNPQGVGELFSALFH